MIKVFTKDLTMQKIKAVYNPRLIAFITLLLLPLFATAVFAHGVSESDKLFIEQISGIIRLQCRDLRLQRIVHRSSCLPARE